MARRRAAVAVAGGCPPLDVDALAAHLVAVDHHDVDALADAVEQLRAAEVADRSCPNRAACPVHESAPLASYWRELRWSAAWPAPHQHAHALFAVPGGRERLQRDAQTWTSLGYCCPWDYRNACPR